MINVNVSGSEYVMQTTLAVNAHLANVHQLH
jgi:hypothetical protein